MNCVDVERVNHPELVCPLQPYTCLGMEWLTQVGSGLLFFMRY